MTLIPRLAAALLACALVPSALATTLTDIVVFSSNSEGNAWNGLVWNTEGADTDSRGIWNLYVTPDAPGTPTPSFVNHGNDAGTRIALPVATGSTTWSLFAEGVGNGFDPAQFFAIGLYFDGVQSAPRISAVQNLANNALAAAGHPNGVDPFGNGPHQEAGTLTTYFGNLAITLTAFTWDTNAQRDVVWSHWANDAPYGNGSGTADYIGSITLDVRVIPLPGTLALLAAALGAAALARRRA